MLANFYQSVELRWFWPGHDQEEALLDYFTRRGHLAVLAEMEGDVPRPDAAPFVRQEQPRADAYLLLPDCATVGVKQRQGRLEVKALVSGPRPYAQGEVAGLVDQWVKWSWQPAAEIALPLAADLRQAGPWRQVEKRRYTQRYGRLAGGITAVSPDFWPDAGCNIELTLVNAGGPQASWLTFGFEAFGAANRLADLLAASAAHFFTTHGPPPLRFARRDSLSYPAWLARLR